MIRKEGLVDSGTLELLPEPSPINDQGLIFNGLLIGNTKNIWPLFLRWIANRNEQINSPFDTFVEAMIPQAISECCGDGSKIKSYELFWSNGNRKKVELKCKDPISTKDSNNSYHCYNYKENSFLVSMQRVAKVTGEYWHDDEATKLCVHRTYGTWTAFRAVVVFETIDSTQLAPIPPAPQLCSCPVSNEELIKAIEVFDHALKLSSSDELGYGSTLDKSWEELCKYLHNTVCSGSEWEKVPSTMKPWIQLRDVISVGRKMWKYCDNQLLYHYTKDPEILDRELKKIRGEA